MIHQDTKAETVATGVGERSKPLYICLSIQLDVILEKTIELLETQIVAVVNEMANKRLINKYQVKITLNFTTSCQIIVGPFSITAQWTKHHFFC